MVGKVLLPSLIIQVQFPQPTHQRKRTEPCKSSSGLHVCGVVHVPHPQTHTINKYMGEKSRGSVDRLRYINKIRQLWS